jgi:ATP/maltotriose-dependent transcriptional regulator MalT
MILIGRTLPPAPLWRMRSKQTLCVIDEAALAFTLAEARELFASYGSRPEGAAQALAETWGRAAALDRAAQVSTEVAREDSLRHHAPVINASTPQRHNNSRLRLVQEEFSKSSLGAT